jgi:hypothetical protein
MQTTLLLSALLFLAGTRAEDPQVAIDSEEVEQALARGVEILLELQEGESASEWPYEGVYRLDGDIPYGYRVGGTALCALALLHAPGYSQDQSRLQAVQRAVQFVVDSIRDPEMGTKVPRSYDVRGWGYAYGMTLLARLKLTSKIPKGLERSADKALKFFLAGIEATEIPKSGGWNYSRRGGFSAAGPSSPFMTAATVQALLLAQQAGLRVSSSLIERGLQALQDARTGAGAFVYSGTAEDKPSRTDAVPGAIARMAAAEATLYLCGEGNLDAVRGSVDAFLVHWGRLEERRSKTGTHEGDYGIAPYYFFFGHYYAAQAIELLPEGVRQEYREHLCGVVFRVRHEDGRWNDRVFARSANYGTAMAMMALQMQDIPIPEGKSKRGRSSRGGTGR